MQTLSKSGIQVQCLRLGIAKYLVRPAGFDTTQHTDKSLRQPFPANEFLRQILLRDGRTLQILNGSSLRRSVSFNRSFELCGEAFHKWLEILQQHISVRQPFHHQYRDRQIPKCSAKSYPVQTTQHSTDAFAVLFDKLSHGGVLPRRENGICLTPSLYRESPPFSPPARKTEVVEHNSRSKLGCGRSPRQVIGRINWQVDM